MSFSSRSCANELNKFANQLGGNGPKLAGLEGLEGLGELEEFEGLEGLEGGSGSLDSLRWFWTH